MERRRTRSPASRWKAAIASARPWCPPTATTLVVAPHPDDESLMTGGLLGHLRDRAVGVVVLAVTDGEAAYPNADRAELGRRRRSEQRAALLDMGVDPTAVWRAGVPDGGVPDNEELVCDLVARIVAERSIRHVVAPWPLDHHCDHEAVGRAATAAAESADIAITYGVFWGFFHRTAPDPADHTVLRLDLTDVERRRKAAAIGRHRSQTTTRWADEPVLSAIELAPPSWPFELFLGPPT